MTRKTIELQNDSGWIPLSDVAGLAAYPGAYGLVIRLPAKFAGLVGALGPVTLPPGNYLYLGSAYGPGGVAARLRRHLRAEKRLHWHVDYVTQQDRVTHVFVLPNGRECDLVARALILQDVEIPVAGFGSSDCRQCKAHLLALPRDTEPLFNAFSDLL